MAEKCSRFLVGEMDELTLLSLSFVGVFFVCVSAALLRSLRYTPRRGADVFISLPKNTNATKAGRKINTNRFQSVAAASNTIKVKGNKAATLITLNYPSCH